MSNGWVILAVTTGLIALSAFFVAVEFALLAAKRHRLEDAAPTSRAARAALRSSGELTLLLAGSQLGITACTLALGAVTKPAVHYAITPIAVDLGLPYAAADVIGFVLALVIVTFLHLVVGEMAPKSWAIAHPETSATLLALPMRGFMFLFRPLLRALNEAANWCLRRVGVTPVNELAGGSTADDLRQLVEHSASVGALDVAYSAQLAGALDLQRLTLRDLVSDHPAPVSVSARGTVGEVRAEARRSGHLRILVHDDDGSAPSGVVHVRETLQLASDVPVSDLTRPVFELTADIPLHAALARMRETSNHLAVVDLDGAPRVVTLADVLATLFPKTVAEGVAEGAAAAAAAQARASTL